MSLSLAGMVIVNIWNIQKKLSEMPSIESSSSKQASNIEPIIPLSREGKNVMVIMLDRAISGYIPYIFNEKRELLDEFSGFTYFPNTTSFGPFTNFGVLGLFGGYEYTPKAMNERKDKRLADKHDEALKLMPIIFSENGYEVTVCDPPYAGYKWVSDLSIYDDCPGVKAIKTMGKYMADFALESVDNIDAYQKRSFFCYGLFKTVPVFLQELAYDSGRYYSTNTDDNVLNRAFVNSYSVLTNLERLTEVNADDKNTFLILVNDATHEPVELQEPEYVPTNYVDNSSFEKGFREDGRGNRITFDTEDQIAHYHANMASMIQLGKWFNYLKHENIYDNTRIVIVSDHGRGIQQFKNLIMDDKLDVGRVAALLMFKDFNAGGTGNTSDEFMTVADTPYLAMEGIIDKPLNPFTGTEITSEEKNLHDQWVTTSSNLDVEANNGNVFDTSDGYWYTVHDDIYKKENWRRMD